MFKGHLNNQHSCGGPIGTNGVCDCGDVCAQISQLRPILRRHARSLCLRFLWSKLWHILTSSCWAQDSKCAETCLHSPFTFRPPAHWHTVVAQVICYLTQVAKWHLHWGWDRNDACTDSASLWARRKIGPFRVKQPQKKHSMTTQK